MEKIADKLTQMLIRENVIKDSAAEIYRYGLLRMIEVGVAVFSGFVICLSMGMVREGIVFHVFFAPLRSYLGGVHLKKYWQCYIVSCLALVVVMLITKYFSPNIHIIGALTILGVIGIGIEAKWGQRTQDSKNYAIIVWAVLAVLSVVSVWSYMKKYDSVSVLLCCTVLLVFGSKIMEQVHSNVNTRLCCQVKRNCRNY